MHPNQHFEGRKKLFFSENYFLWYVSRQRVELVMVAIMLSRLGLVNKTCWSSDKKIRESTHYRKRQQLILKTGFQFFLLALNDGGPRWSKAQLQENELWRDRQATAGSGSFCWSIQIQTWQSNLWCHKHQILPKQWWRALKCDTKVVVTDFKNENNIKPMQFNLIVHCSELHC